MAAKPTRLPRRVLRPMPEKRFRKTVLGRIHLDRARSFVDEAFEQVGDTRQLRDSLQPEDRKRLARVLKEARRNKGLFRMGRLMVVVILLGLIAGGALVFKDRLMTRALEELLTRAAGAESNVAGLSFRPLRGELSTGGIRITDAGRPTHNILSLETTSFRISTLDLLRGSFIIEAMEGGGLAFGTRREEPGLVLEGGGATGSLAALGEDSFERGGSALEETMASLSLDRDPAAVIDELRARLESEALIAQATRDAENLARDWQQQLAAGRASIAELETLAGEIQDLRPADLNSPAALQDARETVESAGSRAQMLAGDLQESYARLDGRLGELRRLPARINAAVEADMELLRAQVPDGGMDLDSLARSTLQTFLASFLGNSYTRVTGIVTRLEQLQSLREPDQPTDGPGRGGVDIPFGSRALPRFLLREAQLSGALRVTLADVSSDPELTGRPVRLAVDAAGYAASGSVDLRESAAERASYQLLVPGLNPGLPPQAADLGFERVSGAGTLELSGNLSQDDRASGTLDLAVASLEVAAGPDAGRATNIIASLLTDAGSVEAVLEYELEDGRLRRLDGESTLRDALAGGVDALLDGLRSQAEARLRNELDRQIAERLAAYQDQLALLDGLQLESLEQLSSAATYREAVDAQEAALRARIAEVEGRAREEAEQLEAEARAEAEARGEAASDEARDQLEDAVRDRLPGFGRR